MKAGSLYSKFAEENKGNSRLRISGPTSGPAFYLNWDAPTSVLREEPSGTSAYARLYPMPSTVKLREYMVRVRDLHTDNIPIIVTGSPYHVWGANTRLGNVPLNISPLDEHRGTSHPVFHEQLFIRKITSD